MDLKIDLTSIDNDVSSRVVKTPTGERSFTCTFEDPIDTALSEMIHGLNAFMFAANVEDVYDLKSERISTKLNKTQLSRFCHDMAHYMARGVKALSQAGKDKRKHQSQMIEIQNDIIELQAKLITCQENNTEVIQTVMKNEVKSWSEILTKNVTKEASASRVHPVSSKQLERVVKKVVSEEDRSKNLIVYGVEESKSEDVDVIVADIMEIVGEKPRIVERRRIGLPRSGRQRPIRVTLTSGDVVQQILRKSGNLKKSANHSRTYIESDKTVSERAEHRKLVDELKKKIESDPQQYHCIRQKKIISLKKSDEGT